MKKKVKTYDGGSVRVLYDIPRCIHVARCVEQLPKVFDKDRRPWIEPDHDAAQAVADVCVACPTGALKFERLDGGAAEVAPSDNVITIASDGPLYVHGDIELVDSDGNVLLQDTRVALCRCGVSENKPLCDGRHEAAGFKDSGASKGPARDEQSDDTVLRITLRKNGPLLLSGPYRIVDASGATTTTMVKGALCRCGASNTRPFCDGTHDTTGFQAD